MNVESIEDMLKGLEAGATRTWLVHLLEVKGNCECESCRWAREEIRAYFEPHIGGE